MKALFAASVLLAAAALAYGPPPSRLGVSPEVVEITRRPLDAAEASVLKRRGFVVTDKSAPSFHVGYTSLFREHQPVYVSADAILEAWHASYGSIFAELEAGALAPALSAMTAELRKNLAGRAPQKGQDQARKDVDVFLGVAASLLAGSIQDPVAGGDREAIESIARRVHAGEGEGAIELFGQRLELDHGASQPRGHYASTVELQRYFRASSWFRQVELRLASDESGKWVVDRRAVEATDVLRGLFRGEADVRWRELDGVLTTRSGPSSSLSPSRFDAAVKRLGTPLGKATDKALALTFLPEAAPRILPTLDAHATRYLSFVVFGPRTSFDSLVLQATSASKVRPMPRPLDVAATVWSNESARKLLQPDIVSYGAELTTPLDTLRATADAAGPELWQNSLHHRWLRVLRELSPNAERDRSLPEPLRSDAWSLRLLNTQLASWTQLRHDRIPLAKPAERGVSVCEYPAGYVEPYPAFFSALEELSRGARIAFDSIPIQTPVKAKAMAFFDRFAGTMGSLRALAEKERASLPFNDVDLAFFNRMVSIDGKTAGCSLQLEPGGWYGDLYYDRSEAIWGAPTITDVFTQPVDENGATVGRVLHVATGDPRMFAVTLVHEAAPQKRGEKPTKGCDGKRHEHTYRGFVSAYTERTSEGFVRFDDQAWSEYLLKGGKATPPKWMRALMPE